MTVELLGWTTWKTLNVKITTTMCSAEYTKGVLQTIGYKEFIPYLEKFNATNDEKIEEYLRLNSYKMPSEGKLSYSYI